MLSCIDLVVSERRMILNLFAKRPRTLPLFAIFSVGANEFALDAIDGTISDPVLEVLRPRVVSKYDDGDVVVGDR